MIQEPLSPMDKRSDDIAFMQALKLLKALVRIPSFSREELHTADLIKDFLEAEGIPVLRNGNNIYCYNKYFDARKASILLNSHHDTVKPNESYKNDPYQPLETNGRLFGLGTTDAGASLVCLALAFCLFYDHADLEYNLVFAASAEEEISGTGGIEMLWKEKSFHLLFSTPGSFAIVGEPTKLDLAIAEKGLLVIDCIAHGVAGHAARNEGVNAIYEAMKAISWLQSYKFDEDSELLGEVKMTVTSINSENQAHNVIPSTCTFVLDVRINEKYSHEKILEILQKNLTIELNPRSIRLRPSSINIDHPVVQAGIQLGKKIYGSPTLSDQSLIPLPSLKCGPGDSAQSHQADEFIKVNDIRDGYCFYRELLSLLLLPKT